MGIAIGKLRMSTDDCNAQLFRFFVTSFINEAASFNVMVAGKINTTSIYAGSPPWQLYRWRLRLPTSSPLL